jgi:hypothetical protein
MAWLTVRVASIWVTLRPPCFDWIRSIMRLVVLFVSGVLCVSVVAQVGVGLSRSREVKIENSIRR